MPSRPDLLPPSVLFVCHGNTCRSVMAEALARGQFGDTVRVASAGIAPQGTADATNAIETLHALFGLDASGHKPRDVRSVDLESFDCIIAMDKRVAKCLPNVPPAKLVVWQIPDPWGDDSLEYRRCALKINQEVSRLRLGRGRITAHQEQPRG